MSEEMPRGWINRGSVLHFARRLYGDENNIAGWVAYCRDDRLTYLDYIDEGEGSVPLRPPCFRCTLKLERARTTAQPFTDLTEALRLLWALATEASRPFYDTPGLVPAIKVAYAFIDSHKEAQS